MEIKYAMLGYTRNQEPFATMDVTSEQAREETEARDIEGYLLSRVDVDADRPKPAPDMIARVRKDGKLEQAEVREFVFRFMLTPGLTDGSEYA